MSYKESYTETLRNKFLKYTREAFNLLPKMVNPEILELGCGSGTITLELARLTEGNITAIDIDQGLLEQLEFKLKQNNLMNRVNIKKMDLLKNNFPNDHFDLIWEEGVVQIIGIKKSLDACFRILKEGNYLVLGQAIKTINKNIITKAGFELINQLLWTEGCWWTEYYEPLEKKIMEIKEGKEDPAIFENISAVEAEISMVKANPKATDCAHFILQKIE